MVNSDLAATDVMELDRNAEQRDETSDFRQTEFRLTSLGLLLVGTA